MSTRVEPARPENGAPVLAGQSGLADLLRDKIQLTKAAQMLDMSVCHIHRLRLAGKIACFKISGTWYTNERALLTFLEECNPQAPTVATVTSARRRREIEAAVRECERLGC